MIPSDVQRETFDESNLCIRVQTINIHMLGIHNIDNRQKPRVEFMICFEFLSLTQSYPGLHLCFMVNKFRFTDKTKDLSGFLCAFMAHLTSKPPVRMLIRRPLSISVD